MKAAFAHLVFFLSVFQTAEQCCGASNEWVNPRDVTWESLQRPEFTSEIVNPPKYREMDAADLELLAINDHRAAGFLAEALMRGSQGAVKNFERAVEIARDAAAKGSAEGIYVIGVAFATGICTNQNDARAIACFQHAAGLGHAEAVMAEGKLRMYGSPEVKDIAQGLKLLRTASSAGSIKATRMLIDAYWRGAVVEKSYWRSYVFARRLTGQDPEFASAKWILDLPIYVGVVGAITIGLVLKRRRSRISRKDGNPHLVAVPPPAEEQRGI